MSKNGGWDWARLASVLPDNLVNTIISMTPPSSTAGEDRLTWKWRAKANFSSAETYKKLFHPASIVNSSYAGI